MTSWVLYTIFSNLVSALAYTDIYYMGAHARMWAFGENGLMMVDFFFFCQKKFEISYNFWINDWSKIQALQQQSFFVHQIHWDNTTFLHILKCWSEFGHECKSTSTITTSSEDKSQPVLPTFTENCWKVCKVLIYSQAFWKMGIGHSHDFFKLKM